MNETFDRATLAELAAGGALRIEVVSRLGKPAIVRIRVTRCAAVDITLSHQELPGFGGDNHGE